MAESFNAAVKVERVNRTAYPTREHARKDVARYIELRYNTKRLHSALAIAPHKKPTTSTLPDDLQHELGPYQLSGRRGAAQRELA